MKSPHLSKAGNQNRARVRVIAGIACLAGVVLAANPAAAGDWPTYRADVRRSAVTAETVGPELYMNWVYLPAHKPKPAWPDPAEEMPRAHSDNANHVAIAGGKVFFGNSVTDQMFCFDAASGDQAWVFQVEGPIRFAPTVAGGRVYFGSDDGCVYCLNARSGSLLWKYRAGPTGEKVIGNGRMISMWPIRTSVLVDNGQVLFCGGVFPYEGLYLCALDARDGSVIWRNDTIGDRAHELDWGGIAPHGYLVASKDMVYVPSGRAMPAAFSRTTGAFVFYAPAGGKRGGVWSLLDDGTLIAGVDASGVPQKAGFDAATGRSRPDVFGLFPGVDMALTSQAAYIATMTGVQGIDRVAYAQAARGTSEMDRESRRLNGELTALRGKLAGAAESDKADLNKRIDTLTATIYQLSQEGKDLRGSAPKWSYPAERLCSVMLAGATVFAGGDGAVVGMDAQTGKELWKASVRGKAVGLAASDGRLLVSTDEGPVYCFSASKPAQARQIKPKKGAFPQNSLTGTYREAARQIVKESGVTKGYCLVLNCGEGRLAAELAACTDLRIVGIEQDAAKLAAARKNLEAAGLLGARVEVGSWDISTLPAYFANLIVSDQAVVKEIPPASGETAPREELWRVLRPYGGTICRLVREGGRLAFRKEVRGPLEGAGAWTQQFANAQNTANSQDKLVNGPLGMLWYGEPGPQRMVERHGGAQAPVARDGRLFIEGEEVIMAVDAYNGTLLWERAIPGAVRVKMNEDSGNLVLTKEGLFIAAHDKCYRLDPATGETLTTYTMPEQAGAGTRRWGFITVEDGILYGSAAEPFKQDYADLFKVLIENGKWKDPGEIPEQYMRLYRRYKQAYPVPNEELHWAAERDGALYSSMTRFPHGGEFTQKNAVTENLLTSDKVFALDIKTGGLVWSHDGARIANVALVLGGGNIYFADSAVTAAQRTRALSDRKDLIRAGSYKVRSEVPDELKEAKARLARLRSGNPSANTSQLDYKIESLASELFREENPEGILGYADADVRLVTALNAKTGARIWEKPVDLTGCCGDKMGAMFADGLVLFCGNYGNHDAWRFQTDALKWRRITALTGATGDVAWSRALNYRTRPLIVGDQIILEPQACKIATGDIITRSHPITGEQVPWEFLRPGHTCGITGASAAALFYRSSCTAFCDVAEDRGVTIFGAVRPGCAISLIPACGVLLAPEASAGCTCSYPIRCSFALVRKPERAQPWTVFITPKSEAPARHFAINLGAPADMKDDEGTVWFAYPNPVTQYVSNHFPGYGVKFDLRETVAGGMGYFAHDFKAIRVEGTDKPWLFTSGCVGLLRCEVPLCDEGDALAYCVRLGFMAPEGDQPGRRVFDVRIQGKVVLSDFDIAKEAGGANKAIVKEIPGVSVKGRLAVELVPKGSVVEASQAPLVNFIEAVREDTLAQARVPRVEAR